MTLQVTLQVPLVTPDDTSVNKQITPEITIRVIPGGTSIQVTLGETPGDTI